MSKETVEGIFFRGEPRPGKMVGTLEWWAWFHRVVPKFVNKPVRVTLEVVEKVQNDAEKER